MLTVFDFTILYTTMARIKHIRIIITITSAEGMKILNYISLMHSRIIIYPTQKKYSTLVYHISTWNGLKENNQNIH